VWTVAVLAVVGGGVTIAWPQLAPYAEPHVTNLRALLGLTQPMPASEPISEPVAEPVAEVASAPVTQEEPAPAAEPEPAPTPEPSVEAAPIAGPVAEAVTEPVSEPTAAVQAAPTVDNSAVEALAGRLDDLESQIDTLYKTDQSEDLARALDGVKAELATLRNRLGALEQAPRIDPTASAQALVLAATPSWPPWNASRPVTTWSPGH
ncbi:hypothetical protein ACFL12_07980, partial [Pseudomonadota bacterium]